MVRPKVEKPDVLIKSSPELRAASIAILNMLEASEGEHVELRGAYNAVGIPGSMVSTLRRLCRYLSVGSAVSLAPHAAELTSQSAADLLGISRTRLIQLVERGAIGARREGAHRRLKLEEVLAFREERERRQRTAAGSIANLAARTDHGMAELGEARRRAAESKILSQ